jgi:hypothetical protein
VRWPIPYAQIVSWGFGDFAFKQDFDNVSNTIKSGLAGFHDCIDTETMFSQFFEKLREMKLLPPEMREAYSKRFGNQLSNNRSQTVATRTTTAKSTRFTYDKH